MKAHKLLASGVSAALLVAVALAGSACVVEPEDDADATVETGETDQEIVSPPAMPEPDTGGAAVELRPAPAKVTAGTKGKREAKGSGPTIPGSEHVEPEPDPWQPGEPGKPDPME